MTEQAAEVPDRVWMTYEQAAAYCNVDRVTLWRSVKRESFALVACVARSASIETIWTSSCVSAGTSAEGKASSACSRRTSSPYSLIPTIPRRWSSFPWLR